MRRARQKKEKQKRDDEHYMYVACWKYEGSDEAAPELLKEDLDYQYIKVQTRITNHNKESKQMDKNISFTLKVWRQNGPTAEGHFDTFEMRIFQAILPFWKCWIFSTNSL